MDFEYIPGADEPPIQFDDDDEISPEEAQMVRPVFFSTTAVFFLNNKYI